MKNVYLLVLVLLVSTSVVFAETQDCHVTTKKEISALFERWNASLQTGDAQKVVDNYARQSILLPTVSNTSRLTSAAKKDYFTHFLKRQPKGKIDLSIIDIGCNTAVDSGLYTFAFNDGKQVRARYTYVYIWEGNQWLISSHHSSVMPEEYVQKSKI